MGEATIRARPPWLGAAPRFLIVRLSALGDTLMSSPVAQALREAFPHAHIGWVAEKRCAPVVEGNPYLNRVHLWDGTLRGLLETVQDIRRERYEVALDVQGLLKSALIPWLARIPVRIGFANAREGSVRLLTHTVPPPPPTPFASGRNLHLLKALGVPVDFHRHRLFFPLAEGHREAARRHIAALGLEPKRFVVLTPATTRPQKHWVKERWSELATRLWTEQKMPAVLLGSANDRPLLQWIAAQCPAPVFVVCHLPLKEAVALIEQAAVLVGPDSFPIHAALAVGTPAVALFGPNDPYRFRNELGIRVLEHDLPCRPCGRRPTCGGTFPCMAMITVDEVLAAIEAFLRSDFSVRLL